MNEIGSFSEKGNEYIIKKYELKRPMLNYFWNDKILIGVNHQGGGLGAYRGNTTAYIGEQGKPRAQLINNGNRYFYIKDEETGKLWNPGWYPTREELDGFCCTHGLGYSKVAGEKDQISVTLTGCADCGEPVELWEVSLTNNSDREREIRLYPFVEFSLEGYEHNSEYDSWVKAYFCKESNMIFADNSAEERPHPWYNGFCAADSEVLSYDTSKNKFLGVYGSVQYPDAIKNGGLCNSDAACERMVGAFEHRFVIKSGETVKYHFTVGIADSESRAAEISAKVLKDGYFDENMKKVLEAQNGLTERCMFYSPDSRLNNLANYWLKQQTQLCAEVGRGAGKGFRDQLQDAWAISGFNPKMSRDKIYETLEQIYHTGRCVRGWLPLKDRNCSDGPTWVAPAINAYLKETADYGFLDEKVKYLDEGEDTVWEHILTTVRYSSDDTGERGLVLAHVGDWNDSLNGMGKGGKGESVWTSIALYNALLNAAEIAEKIKKDDETAHEMIQRAEKIKKAINKNGWDGSWYLAGYRDDGEKVGTHSEKEGMIYLNPQTWAAIAGVADEDKLEKCIAAADKYLDSDYGPLTLTPAYRKYDPRIGRLTGFIPGIWENGAPYCHGGAFKVISDCVLGRGDQAYESMLKIAPDSELNPSLHSGCEPYAFTNMYFGPENPRKGETSFAWITGTAGWIYRAITQYMLGVHPEYDGLVIKPCIPSKWDSVKGKRVFRGDTYNIEINNPDGKCTGVSEITVDGEKISGDFVPFIGDGKEHKIEVVL